MEFSKMWADFSRGAKEIAGYTAKKTGECADLAKLKIKLKTEEARLEDCFVDAGMLYYDSIKNDNDHTDEIAEIFSKCDEIGDGIEGIREKIASINGNTICKKCGTEFDGSYEFCPYCGQAVEK